MSVFSIDKIKIVVNKTQDKINLLFYIYQINIMKRKLSSFENKDNRIIASKKIILRKKKKTLSF